MRALLAEIAAVILCSTVLATAAQAQPAPVPLPCPNVDGFQCPDEWYTYRYNAARTGTQPFASPLSDPAKIGGGWLRVKRQFPRSDTGIGNFIASPIVVDDTVFIGTGGYIRDEQGHQGQFNSVNGRFYAFNIATGDMKWMYPPVSFPLLNGSCTGGPSDYRTYGHYGISSSATFAVIGGQHAVIFGAPDPHADVDGGLGSARLFALNAETGRPIWAADGVHAGSDVVAHVTGCTRDNTYELHERIAYSAPLVLGNRVYVGIHDTDDDPIQKGKVVAVDLNTGHRIDEFNFVATGRPGDGTRGGGIWNSLATDGVGVFFTTGNTATDPDIQSSEPRPNHGLSMIRVDKDTGNIRWAFQPVPYELDGDADWAADATIMSTSCGKLAASVMKDGFSYAVDAESAGSGICRWQFPPVNPPATDPPACTSTGYSKFDPNWPTPFLRAIHNGHGYLKPGAAWNDVLIINTGGESLTLDPGTEGFGKLHALNACATTEQDRVRWIADLNVPDNALGAPTVTGGLVYVVTNHDLVVLADPSVAPAGERERVCSNPKYPASACPSPYAPVWSLRPLAVVETCDHGDLAFVRKEAALAKGRVFVASTGGHVYMLDANTPPPPPPPGQKPCVQACQQAAQECRQECRVSCDDTPRNDWLSGCARTEAACEDKCPGIHLPCIQP